MIRVVDRVEVGGTGEGRGSHGVLVAVLGGGAFAQVDGAGRDGCRRRCRNSRTGGRCVLCDFAGTAEAVLPLAEPVATPGAK